MELSWHLVECQLGNITANCISIFLNEPRDCVLTMTLLSARNIDFMPELIFMMLKTFGCSDAAALVIESEIKETE